MITQSELVEAFCTAIPPSILPGDVGVYAEGRYHGYHQNAYHGQHHGSSLESVWMQGYREGSALKQKYVAAQIAGQFIPPSIHKRDTIGGGDIIDINVSMNQVNALDTEMRKLNQSVMALPPPKASDYDWTKPTNPHDWPHDFANWQAFQFNWQQLFIAWRGWVNLHFSTLSRTGEQAIQEFEVYTNQYDAFLARFKKEYPSSDTPAGKYENPDTGTFETIGKGAGVLLLVGLVVGGVLLYRELAPQKVVAV